MSDTEDHTFSVHDELTWRVTDQCPVREMDSMDWERCAVLHNLISRLAWEGTGHPVEEIDRRTWWEVYITDPATEAFMTERLTPSLIKFFKQAHAGNQQQNPCFFFYAQGLSSPRGLWEKQGGGGEDDGFRYMTLYPRTDDGCQSGHVDGLNFNQETHTAIFQMDILDGFITRNGRTIWEPLEVVLSNWLEMIDVGKIIAVPNHSKKDRTRFEPWVLIPYSEKQLEDTLMAFAVLVCIIEALMVKDVPEGKVQSFLQDQILSAPELPKAETIGLMSKEILDSINLPDGFARQFLLRARKPKFKFIAPGLRVLSDSDITNSAFGDVVPSTEYSDLVPPVLLFRGEETLDRMTAHQRQKFPPWPYQEVEAFQSGLYLSSCDRSDQNVFEDGCRLVLPFGIGANGMVVTSMGSMFGEQVETSSESGYVPVGKDLSTELYQMGYPPFAADHDVRLILVLQRWIGMLMREDWKVDKDGVWGRIEMFKLADTQEHWGEFQVFTTW